MSNQKIKWLFVGGLIGIGLGERLVFDLGPNIELVTVTTLLAATYIGKRATFLVPLVILAISDVFLGNTSIALFTWSAYLVIAIFGNYLKSFSHSSLERIVVATLEGVGASIWFFIWTNFGVWLLDSWGMYSHDFAGLIASYINGLPFLRNQLLSNLFIVPFIFVICEGIRQFIFYDKGDADESNGFLF